MDPWNPANISNTMNIVTEEETIISIKSEASQKCAGEAGWEAGWRCCILQGGGGEGEEESSARYAPLLSGNEMSAIHEGTHGGLRRKVRKSPGP